MTNLAIFNRHGMSMEKIAKRMDIAFLVLIDQLIEVGHFITALEMIDMNNRPLPLATCLEQGEVITRYKFTWSSGPAETRQNQFCASFYVLYSKNCKSSADISLSDILALAFHMVN